MKSSPVHSVMATFVLASASAFLHSASAAEPQQSMKMNMPMPAKEASYHAKGVVKSIDAAKQTIILSHEPIAALEWPAMTMGFKVRDKALLAKVAVGKAVAFDLVKEGTDFVIVHIE